METLPEWDDEDRQWQKEAFKHYLAAEKDDFLLVATPGAGKTRFCLRVAHSALYYGIVDQIAIVVPSDALKKQWRDAALACGINLCTDYKSHLKLPGDMHGIATTYAAVGSRNGNEYVDFRFYTENRRTLVIGDEIHHCGDSLKWGDAYINAFGGAVKRLNVTGTPFRSDTNKIPFVDYVREGDYEVSKADFTYSYTEALRDGVVRPVFFNTYEGDLSWMDKAVEYTATFATELSKVQAARRLTVALESDWLAEVLKDANKLLTELRVDHPRAGGLVVAKDKEHAEAIADKLRKVCGGRITVVTHETEGASDEITRFEKSDDEWIVAIRMVSEGVDIKRLRVCVYATNIKTELFFRQVAGRIVRVIPGIFEQFAYLFIPKDSVLAGHAEKFKQERAHALDEQRDVDLWEEVYQLRKEEGVRQDNGFRIGEGFAHPDNVIADDEIYTQQELRRTDQVLIEHGLYGQVKTIIAARLFRIHNGVPVQSEPVPARTSPLQTKEIALELRKKELTKRRGGIIGREMAALIEAAQGFLDYQRINRELNYCQGVREQKECTFEQLNDRIEILRAWRKEYADGTGRQFAAKRFLRERAGGSFA